MMPRIERKERFAFTLVEVLIALSIAALGFGVILHSVGLQMSLVAGALERHQMLMAASQVLEFNLSEGKILESRQHIPVVTEQPHSRQSDRIEVARYFYDLDSSPVTADPRIQQVKTTITSDRRSLSLSAYRLKIRRQ